MSRTTGTVLEADLHAFADDFLIPERRAELIGMLQDRPAEARRLADWCMQNEALRRALGKPVSSDFPQTKSLTEPPRLCRFGQRALAPPAARANRKTRKEGEVDVAPLRQSRDRGSAALTGTIGVAIAFGMAMGFIGAESLKPWRPAVQQRATADFSEPFAARVLEAHAVFGTDPIHPVELTASERAKLLGWLDRRLGEPINVPDLSSLRFGFLGGRLIATNAGPTAMLLFEGPRNERLAFMIAHMPGFAYQPRYFEMRGYGAVVWADGANVLALSGAAGEGELTRLAEHVAAPRILVAQ